MSAPSNQVGKVWMFVSERWFDLLNPREDDVYIEDIARSLSRVTRYLGHTKDPISVAQHCILVSTLCHPSNALHGLLHDAGEAYYGDFIKPLKKLPCMDAVLREVCAPVDSVIASTYGLYGSYTPADVHTADLIACATESKFLRGDIPGWIPPAVPMGKSNGVLPVLSSERAEKAFLDRFYELYTPINRKRGILRLL